MNAFHLAFKITDIESTYRFYHEILKCPVGRRTEYWIDFDFFGHQLSAHVSKDIPELDFCGKVDNVSVPIPHFGCLLNEQDFESVKHNLQKHKIEFVVEPQTRYVGQKSEQKTMFVLDFSKNAIEFKCFKHANSIFETNV